MEENSKLVRNRLSKGGSKVLVKSVAHKQYSFIA